MNRTFCKVLKILPYVLILKGTKMTYLLDHFYDAVFLLGAQSL